MPRNAHNKWSHLLWKKAFQTISWSYTVCFTHYGSGDLRTTSWIPEDFNSDYCVYVLKCPCALAYVVKTTGPFRRRSQTQECTQIDLNNQVVVHFVKHKHQIHELWGMVIEHVQQPIRGVDRNCLLLKCEASWIYTLGMVNPGGLNSNLSFVCFLDDR